MDDERPCLGDGALKTLAVLDFEATCEQRGSASGSWDIAQQEIIEVPIALIDIESRAVVARFNSLVRPTRQPTLTSFCTTLTSITQEEVEGQPSITEVMPQASSWLRAAGVTADNTLAVTCGDWDLLTMWPKQVSLAPTLKTPEVFKRWCNLKVVFKEVTGHRKATGMMGMLRHLGIAHVGRHHRGEDDVTNIAAIVVELLGRGARFRVTWTSADRAREARGAHKRLRQAEERLREQALHMKRLPASAPESVRQAAAAALERAREDLTRRRALWSVFSA